MRIILLLALQLLLNEVQAPNVDGSSDPKKSKICMFSSRNPSRLELLARPQRSEVSTTCEGSLTDLSSLANNPGSEGAPHELALILARSEGQFLEKDVDVSQWNGKYICDRHWNELSRNYEHADYKHIIHAKNGKVRCGFPQPNHHRNAFLPWGKLTFDQSKALLLSQHYLLHPGTPLCREHYDVVRALTADIDREDLLAGGEGGQCPMDVDDPEFTLRERKPSVSVDPVRKLFYDLARGAGVTRVECRKSYSELSDRGKRYRLHAAMVLENLIIEMLAENEDDQEALRAAIKANILGRSPSIEDSKMMTDLLTTAAEYYREARNAQERIHILSLYARDIPYRLFAEYVQGLSERLWNQAKKLAIDKTSYLPPDHSKERYDIVKLNFFVSFISSSFIVVGLPWGTKRTTDSKGNQIELPNIIMRTSIYETIRLYEAYMDESGRSSLKLSNSTTYRLLHRLPSMRSHSISCIDYYEADFSRALLDIHKMLDELEKMSLLDRGEVTGYKNSFHQMKQYFNGNFKLHVKPQSYYSDHCIGWALSDPKNPLLVAPHSHAHQKRCAECRGIDSVVEKLRESLTDFKKDAKGDNLKKLAEFVVEYDFNVEKMYELKAHNLRGVFTQLERKRIIESLDNDQCFITADYVQKFLPLFFLESQKLYYGKNGKSWHINHCLCKINGKRVQHSMVHLLDEQDQNSTVVVGVMNHTLSQLKTMGVVAAHIRSDNAGCYHSSSSIASVPEISRLSGVQVLSWSYSEPQTGKSSSDRVAALLKRKMKNYVNKEHDVDTVEKMLEAIDELPHLRGVSVYIGTVKEIEKSPTKISKISEMGHFQFHKSLNVGWRFYGIGQGIPLPDLKPTIATFTVSRSGGKLPSAALNASDRSNLANGISPEFWYLPPEYPPHHPNSHEPNDHDDEEVTGKPLHHNPAAAHHQSLYFCRDCGSSFIRYPNLIKHIESGRHKIRPDRVSLFDRTLGLFKRALEDVQEDLTLSPLSEAIRQIRSGNEPPLPMGWAIRAGKKGARLPVKAKEFITKLWNERRKVHLKLRDEEAWNNMKAEPTIAPEERLTREQVKNLIKTLLQKSKDEEKKSKKTKTRGSRGLAGEEMEEEDEEGVYYEEVDVMEDDVFVTDDEIHIHILKELHSHFSDVKNPIFSDYRVGHDDFE